MKCSETTGDIAYYFMLWLVKYSPPPKWPILCRVGC